MGKSTATHSNQNPGAEVSLRAQPSAAGTPEVSKGTRPETNVGEMPRDYLANLTKEAVIEGLMEDCDEDGGEGSDPPTRSFFRRRLEEQSRLFENTFRQGLTGILEEIHNQNATHTRLLEAVVNNTQHIGYSDRSRQPIPKTNFVPMMPAEAGPARLKMAELDNRGASTSRTEDFDSRVETSVDMVEIQRMIDSALKKGPKFPKFIHPYPAYVERFEYPKGFKIPDFSLFAGETSLSSLEHVARFTAQCGDVNNDLYKLRLFNFSLTGSAFAWYINLPPNSIQNWEELVERFHEQFYRPGMEMSVSSLARMAQDVDESPMDYLTRFKSARNWCRVSLPEVEFVRLALNGLNVEYKKKFLGANFRDMYELAQHVEQYDYLLREEKALRPPSRGTIYKNPSVSYASAESEEYASIDAAEIVIDKPYICKALTQVNPKDVKVRPIAADSAVKTAKVYTFDITKADAIFDQLLLAKIIKLRPGHNIPKAEELKGRIYCKYHDSSKHTTNNCVVFRDTIQKWIDDGKLKFPEKKMTVDTDPFPTTTVGMVDAHLPQDKGKEKIETVSARYIPRKGIKPRLQVDLSSNPPPGDSTRPAIIERVSSSKGEIIPARRYLTKGCQPRLKIDLSSNSPPRDSVKPAIAKSRPGSDAAKPDESATLRTQRKADGPVRPLAQPRQGARSRLCSEPATPQKTSSSDPRNTVFNRLGPQEVKSSSVRRRLNFDTPFYNEEYYSRNSGSSSSSASRGTFKPPEPKDQRWHTYHSSKGVYTALSKSQKRRRQRIDCMARRQAAQEASATSSRQWQPKEKDADDDTQQTPTIMRELAQGKQQADQALITTFEEAEKRIKLLIRPGEMKARLEHFKAAAEDKLPPLPANEPLIKVRRNLHPPFVGEALQYMREFHKTHSANDLYGLPKACQDTIDLVLTCPDAERIIQANSDPGMKARFQHIREARVLGFSVEPYTDIDSSELPFSLEDLQYLRYHFEVFSAVSLFGLTTDEMRRVERLDAYLDTRNARIAYQEQIQATARVSESAPVPTVLDDKEVTLARDLGDNDETLGDEEANFRNEDGNLEDVVFTDEDANFEGEDETLKDEEEYLEDKPLDEEEPLQAEGSNSMGPSILDNMEISMVHVLSADFQSDPTQPSFLDGDVVAEEATQVDFVSLTNPEPATTDDHLKIALAELFPRSSAADLRHLKPLYVTAHIEGYPVSKIFVDCGATVNIMPVSVMQALHRSHDELIPSGITMSSFVGDKSRTKGVLPLEVSIAGRNHMTAFFIVDSKTEYNALLGRDWIHQTSCIPSSLYQVLVFWDGKTVVVHSADHRPFEANMVQARYYDDHVGYITLQGLNEEGRPTRISVQKAVEIGAETVYQDSARLGLANLIIDPDV